MSVHDDEAGARAATPDAAQVDVDELPGGATAALEAVLMVADEPIATVRLASVLALPTTRVEELAAELAAEYRGERGGRPRGFELRHAGEGWRIYSAPAYADVVGRFVLDGQSARLTQAALETLAVVAYRQPVTRGQVSAVRGVNVDGVMRTLTARGLVVEVGTEPTSGALLYGTTGYFLERMGLSSLDELPPLAPYLPEIDALEGVDDTGATIGGPA
ncbi:SMC-Scp complex subunit ScpB [Cellulomonas sp. PSBB021]|uniref:SMC-Scp complex subunit ScpB n=1 Tax=Cellulomonas sp. PSBB021 TaxID=2003551 RepID=UPI000AA95938|nr:SMC-Scp complex subunit ScpB [Cellulomonas sp. PSBB021]ASR54568.1 SMC-Scp complex subunit ScpB [Cellulomonas sp. PSBB021]